MTDLDRFLEEDDLLVPSAGFTNRVMDAVSATADEPPPLPFPWVRLGIVTVAVAAWSASGVWLARTSAAAELWTTYGELADEAPEMNYLAFVVAMTLVSAFVAMRRPRAFNPRG